MITLTVKLFGTFRGICEADRLTLDVETGVSAREVKELIASKIGARLDASALAYGTRILSGIDVIAVSGEVSLLPPVCGG